MAFFIIALSSGPLVQASQETPKLRATRPQEPRRKLQLNTEGEGCNNYSNNCVNGLKCRNNICQTQRKDAWSEEESPCLNRKDHRLKGKKILNMITQEECKRACKAQPDATACQWENNMYDAVFGPLEGGSLGDDGYLGKCQYFTDSDVRDCQYVHWDDEEYELDSCADNYDGNAEYCMVFGAKVESKTKTTCTGQDFKNRFNPEVSPFEGIRVFGCGSGKTKTQCSLGCKSGYTLKNDPNGKFEGTKGTRSKFVATCFNGEVFYGMLPQCSKN